MYWIYKAALQAVLSNIPFGESINHQLQNLRGGNNLSYVDDYIKHGVEIVNLLKDKGLQNIKGIKILEVGTGWMPTFPMFFSLLGAGKIYTYDHVRHLRANLAESTLSRIEKNFSLINKSLEIPMNKLKERQEKIIIGSNLKVLLDSMNIEYIAPGDASCTALPDNSLDLFFSYAVLEHVPEQTVINITKEALRTLKPGGLYYNYIGLGDHYVSFDKKISNVNFLKYPEFIWKLLAKNKITYLNRLRNSQYIEIIKNCGLDIINVDMNIDKHSVEILKKMKVDKRFKNFEPEDLAVSTSGIIALKHTVQN